MVVAGWDNGQPAAGFEHNFVRIGAHNLHALRPAGAAADEETRVWMPHRKFDGGECPLG